MYALNKLARYLNVIFMSHLLCHVVRTRKLTEKNEKDRDVAHVIPSAGRGTSHVGSEGRWDTNNSLVFYSPHIILLTKFQACQRKLNYGKRVADRLFSFDQAVGVNIFYWARMRGLPA